MKFSSLISLINNRLSHSKETGCVINKGLLISDKNLFFLGVQASLPRIIEQKKKNDR